MGKRHDRKIAFRLTALPALLVAAAALARPVEIVVLDKDGEPVPDVAVYVMRGGGARPTAPGTAIMDQRDTQFVPHILVVQKGTAVEFPNSDVVAHHVYSFSKPNNFVLPLYKGDPHDPVVLRHEGIVTLGCNIHDRMLAYIVVVDTDIFGVTDSNGRLVAEVPDGEGDVLVNIWSPRIRDKELTQSISAATDAVVFSLVKKLRPHFDAHTETVEWSEY